MCISLCVYIILILYVFNSEAKKKKALVLEDIAEDDTNKPEPVDNIWIINNHKWKIYSFEEAIQAHREMHHPTMSNLPNIFIKAFIELDMQVKKINIF